MSNKQTTVAPAEQASEEVLALHRQIAAEKLRADQGWQRAESKAKECAELRERLAKQTSEQVPTIDTPGFLRLLFAWHDAEMGRHSQEAYNAIVTHIDANFAGQPAAPVAATEQATDDDLTDVLYPPRAALKAEDWDATTRKPKVKPVAPLATPADAGAGPATKAQLTDEPCTELYRAAISCKHEIDRETVVLHRDDRKEGNALHQLANRLAEAFARLSTPAAPVTASQPAAQVPSRDSELIDRWASWIVLNRPLHFKDHACAQCVPHGDMLVDGFKCVFHEAKDVIGGIYPAAAHAAKEGGAK